MKPPPIKIEKNRTPNSFGKIEYPSLIQNATNGGWSK